MCTSRLRYSDTGKSLPAARSFKGIDSEGGSKFLKFEPWRESDEHAAEDLNLSFRLLNCEGALVKKTLEYNGFRETQGKDDWAILWGVGLLRCSLYLSLNRYQKINHFPRSMEITRKDSLFKNLAKMQALHTCKHYGFFPQTFLLPSEHQSLCMFMERHPNTVWILKPPGGSQGKGILIIRSAAEIPQGHSLVASRYLENPLLIDGRKFDLRIYVAMTSINPLRLYVYKDGLVRFATLPYETGSLGNRFMHLTNYSINKSHPLFSFSSSKWPLSALQAYFQSSNIDFAPIWARIKDIIIKTVMSIESTVNTAVQMYVPHRGCCFELLGFDILLDSNLTAWLLEVNLSPSLNCDSQVDIDVKSRLIADLLTLVGIRKADREPVSTSPIKTRAQAPGLVESQRALRETLEEEKRIGGFERIFPSETSSDYVQFFDEPRPLNEVLIEQLVRKRRKVSSPPRPKKLRPLEHPLKIPRLKRGKQDAVNGSGVLEAQSALRRV